MAEALRSKHMLFWTARTLNSLIRIPLEAWIMSAVIVHLCCPVHVVALRWVNSPSNETYKLSVRFIISEVHCKLEQDKWFNPWRSETKKILSYRIFYCLPHVAETTLRFNFRSRITHRGLISYNDLTR
jgi:hypothetical protein